ncbi:hypothetical protein [Solimonas terrae]|uniref:Uncharacterized protein n=1 Tax=Solimonas terrae TaxID=1396819 RepID=A0A6M2BR86_9GAMM|nr:hypothetical protein [Solimonas terrae]NGY04721.1 hypothetical protein [Solimonas terrae]
MQPDELLTLLSAWLDEEADETALQRACEMARTQTLELAALLEWLARYRCAPDRRATALRAVRAALRLPTMPGPACRRDPPR